MANTRQIKRRIVAAQNISKITKAMEMVAASKMKRAQEQATAARPYSRALQSSLQKLSGFTDSSLHPLLATRETGIDVLLLISTDKGLCGSLNTNLFKSMLTWLKAHPEGRVIAVGKKAVAFARVSAVTLYAQFTNLPEKISIHDVLPITTLLMDRFLAAEFHSVTLLYMDFINTLTQHVRTAPLLPITAEHEYREASMIVPEVKSEYIFEPNPSQILNQLLPYYVENTVYQAFLEGRASEHSARMVSMKNAHENAQDLVGDLRLLFNKSRQSAITTELLDITTASMTVNKA